MSTLWGITTFFNPTGAQRRIENYRRFRAASAGQGLRLVTAELVFDDAGYQLEPETDAEVLVRRRAPSVLWQKERLLNLALAALPPECREVCWIDADILFEDDDWIEACVDILAEKAVIQPFSTAIRLPEDGLPEHFPGAEIGRSIRRGTQEGCYKWSLCSRLDRWRSSFTGSPGYAWCAQRSVLDAVGFYDRCIVGGGDREFALAFSFAPDKVPKRHIQIHHPALRADIRPWAERVYAAVGGRIGYRPGVIHHLWHGNASDRNYVDRHAILGEHGFDPSRDITLDAGGCWTWTDQNPGLVAAVLDYFGARNEA